MPDGLSTEEAFRVLQGGGAPKPKPRTLSTDEAFAALTRSPAPVPRETAPVGRPSPIAPGAPGSREAIAAAAERSGDVKAGRDILTQVGEPFVRTNQALFDAAGAAVTGARQYGEGLIDAWGSALSGEDPREGIKKSARGVADVALSVPGIPLSQPMAAYGEALGSVGGPASIYDEADPNAGILGYLGHTARQTASLPLTGLGDAGTALAGATGLSKEDADRVVGLGATALGIPGVRRGIVGGVKGIPGAVGRGVDLATTKPAPALGMPRVAEIRPGAPEPVIRYADLRPQPGGMVRGLPEIPTPPNRTVGTEGSPTAVRAGFRGKTPPAENVLTPAERARLGGQPQEAGTASGAPLPVQGRVGGLTGGMASPEFVRGEAGRPVANERPLGLAPRKPVPPASPEPPPSPSRSSGPATGAATGEPPARTGTSAPAATPEVATRDVAPATPAVAEPPLVAQMRAHVRAGDIEAARDVFRRAPDQATRNAANAWSRGKDPAPAKEGNFGSAPIIRALEAEASAADVAPPPAAAPVPVPQPVKSTARPGGLKRFKKSERGAVGDAGSGGFPDITKPFRERPSASEGWAPEEKAAYNALRERINTEGPPKGSLGKRAKLFARKAEQALVREEAPLERAERAAEGRVADAGPTKLAEATQGASHREANALIETGVLENQTLPDNLTSALRDLKSANLTDVDVYLAAKRFTTRYADLPTGITPEQAKAIVQNFESRPGHADLHRVQKAVHETYRALLRNLFEADRRSPESLKAIEDSNTAYAHIFREIGESSSAAKSVAATGPLKVVGIQKVTGGEQPFRSPISLVREDAARMIAAANKARVKHAILDRLKANPEGWKDFIEEIPREVAKREIPDYDKILADAHKLNSGELSPHEIAAAVEKFHDLGAGDLFAHAEKGTGLQVFKIKDPVLAEYLRGDTPRKGVTMEVMSWLTDKVTPVSTLQRTATTALSPAFGVFNFWKDAHTYLHYSDASAPKAIKNAVRGTWDALRGAAASASGERLPDSFWSKFYKRLGVEGLVGADQMSTRRGFERLAGGPKGGPAKRALVLVGRGIGKAMDTAQTAIGAGESAFRIGEARNVSEIRGMDVTKPLTLEQRTLLRNKAGGITTNFRLGGRVTKAANKWETFVNARIQGVERLRREWRDNPKRMAARTVAYSLIPELALWAYTMSDEKRREAYKTIPTWRRTGFFNIPWENDDGTYSFISLPISPGIHAPTKLFRAMLDYGSEEDGKAALEVATSVAKDLAPLSGDDWIDILTPSVIQPAVNVTRDKSDFTGQRVNPPWFDEGEREWAPETVAKPSTSNTAKKIAEAFSMVGLNPTAAEVDEIIRGYGGTVGKEASRIGHVTSPEGADIPLIGRAIPRESESAVVDRFYKIADRLEGKRSMFLRRSRAGDERASELAIHPRMTTYLSKVKQSLAASREAYSKATTQAEKRKIAAEMDELAKSALTVAEPLLKRQEPVGAGK